jgi:hypothetical protein
MSIDLLQRRRSAKPHLPETLSTQKAEEVSSFMHRSYQLPECLRIRVDPRSCAPPKLQWDEFYDSDNLAHLHSQVETEQHRPNLADFALLEFTMAGKSKITRQDIKNFFKFKWASKRKAQTSK